jgi:hypothetical protein
MEHKRIFPVNPTAIFTVGQPLWAFGPWLGPKFFHQEESQTAGDHQYNHDDGRNNKQSFPRSVFNFFDPSHNLGLMGKENQSP